MHQNKKQQQQKKSSKKIPHPLHTLACRPDDIFAFWSLSKAKQTNKNQQQKNPIKRKLEGEKRGKM